MRRILLTMLVAVGATHAAIAEQVTLVGSPWAPYFEQSLPENGLAAHIVSEAFRRAGYDTVLEVRGWHEALQGAELGIGYVLLSAWRTDQRAETLAFSKAYLQNIVGLVKIRGRAFEYPELFDGSRGDLVMGLVKDYAYGDALAQFSGLRRAEAEALPKAVLDLVKGNTSFIVGDELALRFHVNTYFKEQRDDFEYSRPVAMRGLRIAVSRNHEGHEKIIADFEAAIETMRAERFIQKLRDRYYDSEFQQP